LATVDKKVDQHETECQEISNQIWLPGGNVKDLISYVDDLKDICGSDYKAAQRLGVAKTTISKLRTRKELSEDLAIKIAKILNIELSDLLLAGAIARSEGEVKKAWEKISQNTHRAAILVLGLIPYCSEAYRGVAEIVDALECILC
jgi:transcriptional regulator with XRE-family HTH domain